MAYNRTGSRNFVVPNPAAVNEALYQRAVALVTREKKASVEFLSHALALNFPEVRRLIERMERENVVSPPNHARQREVLV